MHERLATPDAQVRRRRDERFGTAALVERDDAFVVEVHAGGFEQRQRRGT